MNVFKRIFARKTATELPTKSSCSKCGASILISTRDGLGGLCLPCYRSEHDMICKECGRQGSVLLPPTTASSGYLCLGCFKEGRRTPEDFLRFAGMRVSFDTLHAQIEADVEGISVCGTQL
jgi:hypothetical protein